MATNYICERIINTEDKFGNLVDFAKPKGDINAYLNSIEKSNATSSGFFGQKINLPQIKKLSQNELLKIILFFDFIILITSRNKLELATIKALIKNKGSNNPKNWVFFILKMLSLIISEENRIYNFAKQSNKLVLEIYYEDLTDDSDKIFLNFISFINEHKKIRLRENKESLPKLLKYKRSLTDKYILDFLTFLTGKNRSSNKPTIN